MASFSGRERALVAAGLLVGLLLAEVTLRFIGGVFHDDFTTADVQRGWVLRPGFSPELQREARR